MLTAETIKLIAMHAYFRGAIEQTTGSASENSFNEWYKECIRHFPPTEPEGVGVMKGLPPFQLFADSLKLTDNPIDSFTRAGEVFKEGDLVYGTWVDPDGKTYCQEGKIVKYPATGLWVQTQPDGGITEVKRFIFLYHKNK